MIDAIRAADPGAARAATLAHTTAALRWLIDEKVRLEASSDRTTKGA